MTKTIMILAFAATFLAGAAVFGVFSDYEVEAHPHPEPKKPDGPKPPFIDPILKPINATLLEIQLQLADIQVVVDETQAKQDLLDDAIAEVAEGVDDIKLEQFVSKNILCGIATSPAGCLGP